MQEMLKALVYLRKVKIIGLNCLQRLYKIRATKKEKQIKNKC